MNLGILKKITAITFYSIALIIGIIIGHVIVLWAADRDQPVDVQISEILDEHAAPGSYVTQHLKVFRYRQCETYTYRILYDSVGKRHFLESIYQDIPGKKGADDYYQEIKIPSKLSAGPAILIIETRWVCNPLHNLWPLETRTAEFKLDILS